MANGFDACVEAKIKGGMSHQEAMKACKATNTESNLSVVEHKRHESIEI